MSFAHCIELAVQVAFFYRFFEPESFLGNQVVLPGSAAYAELRLNLTN